MVIWLCGPHHNLSSAGVHFNSALDERIKKEHEKKWIMNNCDRDLPKKDKIKAFIDRYGINYLEEEDI